MDGDSTERIPQEGQRPDAEKHGLLARASAFSRSVLGAIQAVAGTTACKGVQVARLKPWALDNGCWIEDPETLGVFSDRGSENEVYMGFDGVNVYKLNDFRYSDDNLTPFFERIEAHNRYFTACPYELIGFAQNRDGKVCAVLRQQFVANAREASAEEIRAEFERMGFRSEDNDGYFTNGIHDIFDAVPNNVLVGDDGNFYFIDTIIFKSNTDGLDTYRRYSPNYTKKQDH